VYVFVCVSIAGVKRHEE